MLKNIWVLIATGFGLGLSPVASGTFGTLLGIPLVYFLFPQLDLTMQITAAVLLTLAAVPVCDKAEKALGGKKDDGRIVADEYLTFPIVMIGLPATSWVMLLVAFLTHRVFDIIKLPPANGLQRLKGGVGITIDDAIASVYALAANWILYWFLLKPQGWA